MVQSAPQKLIGGTSHVHKYRDLRIRAHHSGCSSGLVRSAPPRSGMRAKRGVLVPDATVTVPLVVLTTFSIHNVRGLTRYGWGRQRSQEQSSNGPNQDVAPGIGFAFTARG
jgi:hypothetical protein